MQQYAKCSTRVSIDGLVLKKMSLFAFDPELEQKLNDIDEFIRSQCGEELTDGFDQSEWILPSQTAGEVPPPSSSWNIKGRSESLFIYKALTGGRKSMNWHGKLKDAPASQLSQDTWQTAMK